MEENKNGVAIREERRAMPTLAPQNFAEAQQFAEVIAKTSFVPREFQNKPGEILAAIQFGFEIGVGPMQALQNIAVINGKPAVYGDLALALVQSSGKLEYIEESDDGEKATCKVKRRDMPNSHTVTFSNEQARKAGLAGKQGPWSQYPARMRQFRARGFALRDVFADVLKGLITREEAEDYEKLAIESTAINISALDKPSSPDDTNNEPARGAEQTGNRAEGAPTPTPKPAGQATAPQAAAPAPAKKVVMKPDPPQPAAPPPLAPEQRAQPLPQANRPRLTDGQIKLLFARGRNVGLILGDESAPMMEFLVECGIPAIESDGKTALENLTATMRSIGPNQFKAVADKLDAMARAPKSDAGDAERI